MKNDGSSTVSRRATARWRLVSIALACLAGSAAPAMARGAATDDGFVSVIPAPTSATRLEGSFTLGPDSTIHADPALAGTAEAQIERLRRATGFDLGRAATADGASLVVSRDPSLGPEAYRLRLTPGRAVLEAAAPAGVFYAFQTLRQLLPAAVESTVPVTELPEGDAVDWRAPAVLIEDAPRFRWRGLHLDVARHFFDVEVVKSFIDNMARFKFNRFHWHLTEDQGWRVPIDAYPKLTEIGAWRAGTQIGKTDEIDDVRHGGFYTRDEIREVVAYAAARHVTVVPEIEMPGHASAAIASYPELGCGDEVTEVSPRFGIHEAVFCPTETTFTFLTTVLDEVLELFPSELIHIGGDEVRKSQWTASPVARAVMEREGLADEDALQSWFIRRIEAHLRERGRRLIGWDEILDGGLAPDATVMTWRTEESAVAAARLGHDVIRTPIQHAYFDFSQAEPGTEPLANNWAGFPLPLERVYAFEPVPAALDAEEARHILGGQANLWTEFIKTPEHVEYMVWPRALAMAEVLWSPAAARDWEAFTRRLAATLPHLDALGVDYRWPRELWGERPAR